MSYHFANDILTLGGDVNQIIVDALAKVFPNVNEVVNNTNRTIDVSAFFGDVPNFVKPEETASRYLKLCSDRALQNVNDISPDFDEDMWQYVYQTIYTIAPVISDILKARPQTPQRVSHGNDIPWIIRNGDNGTYIGECRDGIIQNNTVEDVLRDLFILQRSSFYEKMPLIKKKNVLPSGDGDGSVIGANKCAETKFDFPECETDLQKLRACPPQGF